MNPEPLRQKLLAAARSEAPSDHVPYAFEKRVMAHLAGRPVPDAWAAWGALLWRALLPCCGLMLLVAATSLSAPRTDDLGAQLDAVLLADLDTSTETP